MKRLVDKSEFHDVRLLNGIDTGNPAANDDDREWTDEEIAMDLTDWRAKRIPAEIDHFWEKSK